MFNKKQKSRSKNKSTEKEESTPGQRESKQEGDEALNSEVE